MITLTDLAVEKVNQMLSKRGQGLGIRIGVKTTGCSGLAYVLEYVDVAPITRDQHVFEQDGFKIWVDGKSHIYVDGITMDWQKKGLNEGFEFINSKEKARCGCGESFTV
jgi:iron-sulfur cluster assembly protein